MDDLFQAIFGRPQVRLVRPEPQPQTDPDLIKRARYQESLFTELLTELAGKHILTNEQCQNIIKRARERTEAKTEAQAEHSTCPCPNCDTLEHREMHCAFCGGDTAHVIIGFTARCRRCCTDQKAS